MGTLKGGLSRFFGTIGSIFLLTFTTSAEAGGRAGIEAIVSALPQPITRFIEENGWNSYEPYALEELRSRLRSAPPTAEDAARTLAILKPGKPLAHRADVLKLLSHVSDLFPSPVDSALLDLWKTEPVERKLEAVYELTVAASNEALAGRMLKEFASGKVELPTGRGLNLLLDTNDMLQPYGGTDLLERAYKSNVDPSVDSRILLALGRRLSAGAQLQADTMAKMSAELSASLKGKTLSFETLIVATDFVARVPQTEIRADLAGLLRSDRLSELERTLIESVVDVQSANSGDYLIDEYRSVRTELLASHGLSETRRKELNKRLATLETEIKGRNLPLPTDLTSGKLSARPEIRIPEILGTPNEPQLDFAIREILKSAGESGSKTAGFSDYAPAIAAINRPVVAFRDEPIRAPSIHLAPAMAVALARAYSKAHQARDLLKLSDAQTLELFYRLGIRELATTRGDRWIEQERNSLPALNPTSNLFQRKYEVQLADLTERLVDGEARNTVRKALPKPRTPSQIGIEVRGENGQTETVPVNFLRNMVEDARNGDFKPVIGRQAELHDLMTTLLRQEKGNVLLYGEPGVGKTVIAQELARRIAAGEVPAGLRDVMLLNVDVNAMTAGTMYRGSFEEKVQLLTKVARNPNVVLFVDESHQMMGAGGAAGTAPNPLIDAIKPYLATGEIRMITATDLIGLRIFEKDAALNRRFQYVQVKEPTIDEAIAILERRAKGLSEFHGVTFEPGAIEQAVKLSARYVPDRRLPDKAIDLLDQAAAEARMSTKDGAPGTQPFAGIQNTGREVLSKYTQLLKIFGESRNAERVRRDGERDLARDAAGNSSASSKITVSSEQIAKLISQKTGVPVTKIGESEASSLVDLEERLNRHVVDQPDAIGAVANAVRRMRSGLQDPNRPPVFLFLGPSGVGKTETAKALDLEVFGKTHTSMTRIDMSEYHEAHTVSRLIGAPPGYVGHDDGGQLTEPVRRNPYQIILLDEVEKAHPDVFQVLLQLFDDGRLTDGKGRTVNFKNTIIIMTSNIGSREILNMQEAKTTTRRIGFEASREAKTPVATNVFQMMHDQAGGTQRQNSAESRKMVLEWLRKFFAPEFINRIDEVVHFDPLTPEGLTKIVDIQMGNVNRRLEEKGIRVQLSPEAHDLVAKEGFDPNFGARPMKRLVQNWIENPLAQLMVSGKVKSGSVDVEVRNGDLVFLQNGTELRTFVTPKRPMPVVASRESETPIAAPAPTRSVEPRAPIQKEAPATEVRPAASAESKPTPKKERPTVLIGNRDDAYRRTRIGFDPDPVQPTVLSKSQATLRTLGTTTQSGALFSIQAMGSELIIQIANGDWDKLRNWATFDELRKTWKSWATLAASGAAGEKLVRIGFGKLQGRSILASAAVPVELNGKAAFVGRAIPLWFALAGAEWMETGKVSPTSLGINAANVTVAHSIAQLAQKGIRAIRIGSKGVPLAAVSLPETIGLGILEFTAIHYLGELEQAYMEMREKKALYGQLTKDVQRFHQASFTDSVGRGFSNKKIEWAAAYRQLAMDAALLSEGDSIRARLEKDGALKDLANESKGGWLSGPMSAHEIKMKEYLIDQKYQAAIRNQDSALTTQEPVSLPLPLSKSIVGTSGTENRDYATELEEAVARAFDDRKEALQSAQSIVNQTLEAMDRLWSYRENLELAAASN